MKKAIKYIYDANPLFVHKKHYCHNCGNKLELRTMCKVVNSKSPEARNYDFSLADTFLVGDVEFRSKYLHCPTCQKDISFKDIKKQKRYRK